MYIQTKIWPAFTFGLLFLFLVSFSGYRATQQVFETSFWVDHTYEVVASLDTALNRFNDAETGQRGYLLTGDTSYLEPYVNGTAGIARTLFKTRFLTMDNPAQQERVKQIEILSDEKLIELKETIDFYDAGNRTKALELILTDRGKRVMDDIRAVIQDMKFEEENLLAGRKLQSQSAVRSLVLTGSLSGILALFIFAAYVVFTRRNARGYINVTRQSEATLKSAVVDLELSPLGTETLAGILPICRYCKAIRNDQGEWETLESYLAALTGAQLSHSICLDCMSKHSWR